MYTGHGDIGEEGADGRGNVQRIDGTGYFGETDNKAVASRVAERTPATVP